MFEIRKAIKGKPMKSKIGREVAARNKRLLDELKTR
jgi:hypothetical protein